MDRNALEWGRSRWTRIVEWLGGDSLEGSKVFDALVRRYGEVHRHYHTLDHVLACLSVLDQQAPFAVERDAIEMALWFHDAIYEPFAKDNEDRSAELLKQCSRTIGMSHSVTDRAAHLILQTRHSAPPDPSDLAAGYTIDIDLSILGEDPETFDQYEAAVRREYEAVPDADFWRARSGILQGFLDRPAIFTTPVFQTRYEEQARRNLRRSIDRAAVSVVSV